MIIDDHTHFPISDPIWPDEWRKADFMIKSMDQWGIDKSIVVCTDPINGGDYKVGNQKVYDVVKQYPDRLIGFAWIHPTQSEGIEVALQEARRCVKERGFKGLKLHPCTEMYSYASKEYCYPIIEESIKLQVPVFCHTGDPATCPYSGSVLIADLADRYPDAKLILGHLGHRRWNDAIWAVKKRDNLMLDTSFGQTSAITVAVRTLGADRIMMGSDWPINSFGASTGHMKGAFIRDEERQKLMGDNAAEYLRLK